MQANNINVEVLTFVVVDCNMIQFYYRIKS